MNKKLFNKILIISFGVFGLTALIYQVAFAMNLVLLFGLTAPAIATVLAVYFSGLALGSFIFGKIADRLIQNFKQFYLYLGLLIGTGIYGFFVPWLFQILGKIIQWINQFYPLSFSGFNFFAFLLSFLFLIIPAVLIGGAFPIISKILVRESETLGKKISLLYFINTFGSVLGALLAGFWLIPAIGVKMTLFFASGLNLVTAGLLIFFFKYTGVTCAILGFGNEGESVRAREQSSQPAPQKNKFSVLKKEPAALQNNLFVYVLFLTGFLALALEVFYAKTLVLFLGSSTYAFSLVLIIFLLGIALGSLAVSRFLDQIKKGFLFFGLFLGLLGFWLFLTLKFFERIPFWYIRIIQLFEEPNFFAIIFTQSIILFFIILPATFLSGMIFPLAIKLARPNIRKIGQGIGKLYFANTLGGVLGSLAAGFFLLPRFGFQKSLTFILIIYILLAIVFIFKEREKQSSAKIILFAFLVLIMLFSVFSPFWSKNILTVGVFPYARFYFGLSEEEIKKELKEKEVLFYKEGLSQVAVIKDDRLLALKINSKTDASTGVDLETQILMGALPLVFHSHPKDALIIGLGSGITLGTATRFDSLERIDAVEIDPAVIEASNYFKAYNHDALNNPRVRMITADARNYLYLNDKRYDVISSGPSNPWVSGNSYLFTREYYQLVRERLNRDGIILQWIQLYNLEKKDLNAVLKTFQEVFPYTYLFDLVQTNDLILIGKADSELVFDFDRIEQKIKEEKVQNELKRIYIESPYQFLAYFAAGNESIREAAKEAAFHVDDRPFLEFNAPKMIYQNTLVSNFQYLLELKEKEKQEEFVIGGNSGKVLEYFSFRQNLTRAKIAFFSNELDKALEIFEEMVKSDQVFHPFIWGDLYNLYIFKFNQLKELGQEEKAREFLRKAEVIYEKVAK